MQEVGDGRQVGEIFVNTFAFDGLSAELDIAWKGPKIGRL